MGQNLKFDILQNPAMNFSKTIRDLEKIAKDLNSPTSKVISDFMVDIKNYYNEDYERKINIDLQGKVSPNFLNSLNSYLSKMLRKYKTQEKNKANKEKRVIEEQKMEDRWREFEASISGDITNSEIVEKIINNIENSDLSRKEKNFMKVKFDEKREKFVKTWNEIEGIVEKLSLENDNKTKPEYWQAIKDLITQRNKALNIKMDEEMEEQMLSMIDEKILSEKDNLYYEQVKFFTRDFSFLRDYPELQTAVTGHKIRKFTDSESFNRFYDLRALLQNQEGYSELMQIEKILKGKENISDVDRRILDARKNVINKELEDKGQLEAR